MPENNGALIERVRLISGLEINKLQLLAENNYCYIFKAETADQSLIIKKYKTADNSLGEHEAAGVDFYHRIVDGDNDFIDSRALFTDSEMNLVGISFVEGKSFADFIYENGSKSESLSSILFLAERLGFFLKKAREESKKVDAEFTPFNSEYMLYCSEKLCALPIFGRIFFRNYPADAAVLASGLASTSEHPSFAHGDFVFRNIHVAGKRAGLIDFANCLESSHTLNDVFNLWFALQNMIISDGLKEVIWQAFLKGLGETGFSEPVVNFFYEYHRRRWLMLNLCSKDPRRWLRAIYGLKHFARSFREARGQFRL